MNKKKVLLYVSGAALAGAGVVTLVKHARNANRLPEGFDEDEYDDFDLDDYFGPEDEMDDLEEDDEELDEDSDEELDEDSDLFVINIPHTGKGACLKYKLMNLLAKYDYETDEKSCKKCAGKINRLNTDKLLDAVFDTED